MNIMDKPKAYLMFSAPFLILVIHANQVGVGILRFQVGLFETAHHDAWISVMMAATGSHLVVWLMVDILQGYESADLYGVHHHIYGKRLSFVFNLIYIFFMLLVSLVILRSYVEVVQTWMFPEIPAWLMSAVLLFLVVYGIEGGLRTVVGFCVLSFFFAIWMLLILWYDLPYTDIEDFRPIAEAKIGSLLQGAKSMSFTLIGFEILYFIYPFIKQKEQTQRYAHLGLLLTTLIYMVTIVISTMYFSGGQVAHVKWPTLSLFKIIQLPFLERLEYVIVSVWLVVILPNLLLYLWAASRGMKRLFRWKQRYALYLFCVILLIGCISLNTDPQLKKLGVLVDELSFYVVFIYPFLLFGMVKIRTIWGRGEKVIK